MAPTREFVAFSLLCIDASSRTECISFPREHVLHYQVCFAFSRECVAFKALGLVRVIIPRTVLSRFLRKKIKPDNWDSVMASN